MEATILICTFLVGAALGCAIGWSFLRGKIRYARQQTEAKSQAERATLVERLQARDEQIQELKKSVAGKDGAIGNLQNEMTELKTSASELETRIEEERKAAKEKLDILDDAQKKLADAFSALSA